MTTSPLGYGRSPTTKLRHLLLLLLVSSAHLLVAGFSCTTDADCREGLHEDSTCDLTSGRCLNPLAVGGCLQQYLPGGWHKLRVCNSEDPPDAVELGWCRRADIDYLEIRIQPQNWDAAIVNAWLMQILLSELLDVPTTLETSFPDKHVNFYDAPARMDFGAAYDWPSMETAHRARDCRHVKQVNENSDNIATDDVAPDYIPCSHVASEIWLGAVRTSQYLVDAGIAEPPIPLQASADQTWHIPKYTAERDPTLTSYIGLRGEANRAKLAARFPRPINWGTYCREYDPNQCLGSTSANETVIAVRPPMDEDEAVSYFVPDYYWGYFRHTDRNDCEANPDTCTGHFIDYPCAWGSYFQQQSYHLNVSLTNEDIDIQNGRLFAQIWRAANYSKVDVIGYYYQPDRLWQEFLGTDAEFTRVVLPPLTQACLDNRIQVGLRCSGGFAERVGTSLGACKNPPENLQKLLLAGLDQPATEGTPIELVSPARSALVRYENSELRTLEQFEGWSSDAGNPEQLPYAAREAVCRWVVDNFEHFQQFVPETHPRVVVEEIITNDRLHRGGLALAVLGMVVTIALAIQTFRRRRRRIVFYTQIEIMYLVELGSFLLSIAALLRILPANDALCAASPWFINGGHVFALVPVLLRLDGLNRLFTSGQKMQRMRLSNAHIFSALTIVSLAVGIFVGVWTLLDAPRQFAEYTVTAQQTAFGETVLRKSFHCASDSDGWALASVAWRAVVCLFSLVLAFTASRENDGVNDTRALSLLALSNFLLTVVYLVTVLVQDFRQNELQGYQSLLLSLDALVSLVLFIVPKVVWDTGADEFYDDDPLPDLFLRTTIMYADISGFSAWSSQREPAQVFKFLEAVFYAFDEIATKRNVFKVETVADTYVAATGIPNPQADHAVLMAEFALDCLDRLRSITYELEMVYGPDTGDLSLKIGLDSGAVTGGFLQGKNSRFQLFGETVNTASHVEGTGEAGRVHVSDETADLLIQAGKEDWLIKREGLVSIRGHGDMQTYWLKHRAAAVNLEGTNQAIRTLESIIDQNQGEERKARLVDWNVETLLRLLKQIVARRNAQSLRKPATPTVSTLDSSTSSSRDPEGRSTSFGFQSEETLGSTSHRAPTSTCSSYGGADMPLEEVREIIVLPAFDSVVAKRQKDPQTVQIPPEVVDQLRHFVRTVAKMYNYNPFHNFAHASHVVMAMIKYLNRIIAAADLEFEDARLHRQAAALHAHTYGITSDPLTQFACVFAALIHDLDHPGVPNPQLIREDPALAVVYKHRSVAEQNSFDLSWNLFTDPTLRELRDTICGDKLGLSRFRQLVINSVMATDLGDKELKALRNKRWERAFSEVSSSSGSGEEKEQETSSRDAVNRKATIVIEHLIQASDVSHTMQHWDIYREWNENLFMEMYAAYRSGRVENNKNPADFWFKGEIGFFDFYIIPLSKKLSECGVFGITSDENLNYATRNRELWTKHGEEVVRSMLAKAEEQWGSEAEQDNKSTRQLQIPPAGATPEQSARPVEDSGGAAEEDPESALPVVALKKPGLPSTITTGKVADHDQQPLTVHHHSGDDTEAPLVDTFHDESG